jgi:phenylacetate-CoA ligase
MLLRLARTMNPTWIQLYYRLPSALRALAATVRGYQLRSWRYGPETDQIAEKALARERISGRDWSAWQQERLRKVLHRAATRVPFYRAYWKERGATSRSEPWLELRNWPILQKESIRENPRAFLADDCDPDRMFHECTSGTSGKSLDLWFSRDTVREYYAFFEARWRRWYGLSRKDRWAILGGQLVVPVTQRRRPFWVWNGAMNQLYMSSYHLAPDFVVDYWNALRAYRVEYIWGYSSSLAILAQEALRLGLDSLQLKVAITNAEPLFEFQKDFIRRAFGCPVRETYGMCELVTAASECEAGRLHSWPEAGIIEVMNEGERLAAGVAGDLVCTGLFNADMPLIRYRVGDRAAMADPDSVCACGRTMPCFEGIEGRVDDVLFASDGRRVGRLDPVFKSQLPIREAQIEQVALRRFRVRYVPAPEFNARAAKSIIKRLKERLGEVEVVLEEVSAIPRGANGKFRAVICSLPPIQRWRMGV